MVGNLLPNVELYEDNPTNKINLVDLVTGKKVIIFGVPGAFSPSCSKSHLPGFVSKADEFRQKGVDEIICISVNDAFVMGAWAKAQNTTGKVRMLADPTAALAKALDLTMNVEGLGGTRSKRTWRPLPFEDSRVWRIRCFQDPVLYTFKQEVPKRALGSNEQPGSAKKSLIKAFRSQLLDTYSEPESTSHHPTFSRCRKHR
nr:unnamed protein product [Callosobruchus chinensis]